MQTDLTILAMAKGLASHATTRQSLVSQNVANADTVGYLGAIGGDGSTVAQGTQVFARVEAPGHSIAMCSDPGTWTKVPSGRSEASASNLTCWRVRVTRCA